MGGPLRARGNGRFIAPVCSIGQYSPLFLTTRTLKGREGMRIHVGCELSFEFPQTTPMIATLNVHFSRASELERPDYLITNRKFARLPPVAPGDKPMFSICCCPFA